MSNAGMADRNRLLIIYIIIASIFSPYAHFAIAADRISGDNGFW